VEFEKTMRWLNRALLGVALALIGCYVSLIVARPPKASSEEASDEDVRVARGSRVLPLQRLIGDPARYADLFAERQLFRHLVQERARPAEADSAESYKLLGITYDGREYQAHVFEEKSGTYHTFYGEQYMGEYFIEDVDRNRVLLLKGEERLELKK
jgi:hypothetical protein